MLALRSRSLRLLCALLALSAGSATAAVPARAGEAPVAPPAPLPLAWCLQRAEAASPILAAAEDRAQAARQRIRPAGSLDDPRFRYDLVGLPTGDFDLSSTPMSGHQLGLMQKLPFPGLLGSREDAARASAEAASRQLQDQRRRIAGSVERTWAELGYAQRALAITDRNLALLRQLERIAEARYRVGTGLQQDVLRAQVQVTQVLADRLRREAAQRQAEAALADLLDLPPETPLPHTTPIAEDAPPPALAPLLEGLDRTSPRLLAMSQHVEAAKKQVRAAQLEGYPDFDLGVGYRIRRDVPGDPVEGQDFLSASVTVRLPVNRAKWRSRVAEREAELRRTRANYRAARASLRDAVRAEHAMLVRATQDEELVATGLLPQARQSLASSRSGYEVGKVDFLSLIDSETRLFDAELRLERARADHREAFAALEATVGRSLR